ncbi:MAG TPA: prepilin-type N-terminal cleavage/methylation domain-containing protein [Nitrospirota bacterium]|nr:prepilin-type N-terminal cleavage/methylation domain-containing protein [Nitrospirota bacterium]
MRTQKGFTLLEVMVAVVIMGTVLVTLIGLKNGSMQDVLFAEHMTTATMLARNKMVDTLSLMSSKKLQPPLEEEGDFTDDDSLKDFTWKRTVSKIPLPTGNSITEIRVATLWKEGTRQEQVELVSYE